LGQELGAESVCGIEFELNALRKMVDNKINELRVKYFIDGNGLQVIAGNNSHSIGFKIDIDLIKNQD
jgi:hypothetical protein